ncbi:hypothetical protein SAMN05216571_101360 [Onishia taeanensis]|uniref:Imelysin-like domain-containing protein n=1 Tax=Onishia taeanensis TaxID=284577 RepID=A0A1G7NCM9_9GAMM|nr:imelysin family protein [Halomonas taeanensis]SDF71764.1 hypothetical protein SAMN05216571_101360 [Halomonas taeanensis]
MIPKLTSTAFMRHQWFAGLLALTVATPLLAANTDEPPTPRDIWYQAIGDGYAALASDTQRLAEQASDYCQSPSAEEREALANQWLYAYEAWQAVRFVNFGPIEQQSRAWQLQFWPDRKNLVGHKVSAWLKADTAPSMQSIADGSVAIQGFPAIEYLLFDEALGAPEALTEPQACGLLAAITQHLEATTRQLNDDWQAFGDHYRETDSYTRATLEAGLQALELVEAKRLAAPLGMTGGAPNAYLAEAWRSQQSIPLITASLSGLQEDYLPGLRLLLQQADQQALYDDFAATLDEAMDEVDGMEGGIANALEEPAARSAVQGLYVQISQLNWLGSKILIALGITRGFNATDGD